eukprot:261431-Prorocentrum_lima.AAC.1
MCIRDREWLCRSHKEWLRAPVGTKGSMVAEWRGLQGESTAKLWSPEEQVQMERALSAERSCPGGLGAG